VASNAADLGVRMLNDIRGFPDVSDAWAEAVVGSALDLVVMHAVQRGPADRRATRADAVLDGIYRFFDARLDALVRAGIPESRLIVDPGMGFFLGSTPEPSVAVLRDLSRLRAHTGRPIYISVSRKSFLGALLGGRPVGERGLATAIAELWAVVQHDVDYVRTHDPGALRDALRVWAALGPPAGV
jgi:dihydropteroate synthase type 2